MAKYLMLGKYSVEAIKGISKARTKKVADVIKKAAGRIISMYALLGSYDLVFVVDFPGNSAAIKASVALTKLTNIGFTTFPAVNVEEFDKIMG